MTRESAHTCPHESDVLDYVVAGRWPSGADVSLRDHAAACPVCADLVLVAGALTDADADATDARLPDAAVIWYGARLLARTEMARRAARPLLLAQVAGLVVLVAALAAGWVAAGPAITNWWTTGLGLAGSWVPDVSWAAIRTDPTGWLARTTPAERWILAVLAAWPLLVLAALSLVRLADRGEPSMRPPSRP